MSAKRFLSGGGAAGGAWMLGIINGIHRAYGIVVLTAGAAGIARIAIFGDRDLFARFGLPPVHPADAGQAG